MRPGGDPIDVGSRLELFVDTYLVAGMRGGAALRLHEPVWREEALVTDRPWEGNMCNYITVFRDEGKCRMYYQSWHTDFVPDEAGKTQTVHRHPLSIAYAESTDGIHWQRPVLGQFEFDGTKNNNLVWLGEGPQQYGVHGFAPFKDPNPDADEDARYKAVGADMARTKHNLYAMQSRDGIGWQLMSDEPVLREGAFDSQNLAFWDTQREEYRVYFRDFREGRRDIRTATSKDFVNWTDSVWLKYPSAPDEQLYTNQILPYYRAPHIFVGFPTRYVERTWSPAIEALPQLEHRRLRAGVNPRYGTALTDGLFMSSRDGQTFKRWPEAFLRPGPQQERNWAYGDNYQCWGLLETPSDLVGSPFELSFFATENHWRDDFSVFRRYSIRLDGFVSVGAPLSGGELVTKPLVFTGRHLVLNFSTSAAGSLRVALQGGDGTRIEGYSPEDCHELIGDELGRVVAWQSGSDLSALAGKPVRLCFELRDADLYAMRFR